MILAWYQKYQYIVTILKISIKINDKRKQRKLDLLSRHYLSIGHLCKKGNLKPSLDYFLYSILSTLTSAYS